MTRLVLASLLATAIGVGEAPAQQTAEPITSAVAETAGPRLPEWIDKIVQADYAGDRTALERLYLGAEAFLGDPAVESRARYWKGFAKWRRAINGANETIPPSELVADLLLAVDELRRSGELDPSFVDARVGELQCLGLILFFDREHAGNDQRIARLRTLLADLQVTAADNPRYVWAWGMAYFTAPPERGGGPERVIEAYQKALAGVHRGNGAAKTPFDPTWGEAELHVNLAYSYLNKPSPDLALAKHHVEEALRLVPGWHYARDILRPQIEAAASAAAGGH